MRNPLEFLPLTRHQTLSTPTNSPKLNTVVKVTTLLCCVVQCTQ